MLSALTTFSDDLDNFDDYKENIQQNLVLPHTQIISPRDKSLPFGFFIPISKAAEVEFAADTSGWKYYDHDFGSESDVSGLINSTLPPEKGKLPVTDWIRVVLVRSTPILAFHPNKQGRSFSVGNYYANGQPTSAGEEVEKNRGVTGYFKATRYLLYFLDGKNNPIHSQPLQFKAKGGFGGSFGSELRLFRQEFDRTSFNGGLGTSNRWNEEMQALEVFSFRLSIRQNTLADGSRGAWSCFVCERLIPTCKPDMIGVEQMVTRKDGEPVRLIGADWRSCLVPKKSELGLQILNNFQEYKDFGKILTVEPAAEKNPPPLASSDLSFDFEDDEPPY